MIKIYPPTIVIIIYYLKKCEGINLKHSTNT